MLGTSSEKLLPLLLVRGRVRAVVHFLPLTVQSKAKQQPGLQLHDGAAWGKHSERQICLCTAVPQQAPVLEIFTELTLINSPDKSIQW